MIDTKLDQDVDMSIWKDLGAPESVIQALKEKGFTEPTPVQRASLPPAIRDHRDVLGAAETGSGKTLAFGIPLLHRVLQTKEREIQEDEQDIVELDEEEAMDVDGAEDEDVNLSPDEDELLQSWKDGEVEEDLTLLDAEVLVLQEKAKRRIEAKLELDKLKSSYNTTGKLYALVLTPTRELCLQVSNHLAVAAKHTGLQVAAIFGGLAMPKQQRVLKKRPEIIVATPGRLWELVQQDEPHLDSLPDISVLVVDEADRMTEKGHFEELQLLLTHINKVPAKAAKRQTLVFSATLTFVHNAPQRSAANAKQLKKKMQLKNRTTEDKLKELAEDLSLGIRGKPAIVDMSAKGSQSISTGLTEMCARCSQVEKDWMLVWALDWRPGRTIVFLNSKDSVRRLSGVLTVLRRKPICLHADLPQKARLRNLEKFSGDENALLLATDVAARGLDIPDIQNVIHFQIPRTAETYVHRSGRTARASKSGLSLALVSPEEALFYRRALRSLGKETEPPPPPVPSSKDVRLLKESVTLARKLDVERHGLARRRANESWFQKAASEADLDLDEELLHVSDKQEDAVARKAYDIQSKMLGDMLDQLGVPQLSNQQQEAFRQQDRAAFNVAKGENKKKKKISKAVVEENKDSNTSGKKGKREEMPGKKKNLAKHLPKEKNENKASVAIEKKGKKEGIPDKKKNVVKPLPKEKLKKNSAKSTAVTKNLGIVHSDTSLKRKKIDNSAPTKQTKKRKLEMGIEKALVKGPKAAPACPKKKKRRGKARPKHRGLVKRDFNAHTVKSSKITDLST